MRQLGRLNSCPRTRTCRRRVRDDSRRPRRPTWPRRCRRTPRAAGSREERHRSGSRNRMQPPSTSAAQAEGERAEADHLGDLHGRQAPMGIQAVAHGGAGHGREAEVVRQRVGAERGEGDPAVADLVPGIDGAEPVVEGQHAVGQHGPGKRDDQRAGRDGGERRLDVGELEVPELPLHDVDGAHEQQDAEQRREVAEVALQAASAGSVRASAERIRPTVSATPYSATNPPKRGPSCWPSSTW